MRPNPFGADSDDSSSDDDWMHTHHGLSQISSTTRRRHIVESSEDEDDSVKNTDSGNNIMDDEIAMLGKLTLHGSERQSSGFAEKTKGLDKTNKKQLLQTRVDKMRLKKQTVIDLLESSSDDEGDYIQGSEESSEDYSSENNIGEVYEVSNTSFGETTPSHPLGREHLVGKYRDRNNTTEDEYSSQDNDYVPGGDSSSDDDDDEDEEEEEHHPRDDDIDEEAALIEDLTLSDNEADKENSMPPSSAFKTPKKTKKKDGEEKAQAADSAWEHDPVNDEYFLSMSKYKIPRVVWPDFRIPAKLYNRLYPHQRVGVQWMASMHSNGVGGILGDDMGLGKTYQSLTYLGGLMRTGAIRNALVLAPVSILISWEKEAHKVMRLSGCIPELEIVVVSSDMALKKRQRILTQALMCSPNDPHLIISTHNLVSRNRLDYVFDDYGWDYIVLDEGHKIKNVNAEINKACHRIARNADTRRLLLTGTPIQNNLKELWALFDWATSGHLLGPRRRFDNQFGIPIEEGRYENASDITIKLAEKASIRLQEVLRPHFLQRMKNDILEDLPTKKEYVVWTHLSERQRSLYESFVATDDKVAKIIRGDGHSPLEAVTWLTTLCGHPLLVEHPGGQVAKVIGRCSQNYLLKHSAKLEVLAALVNELCSSGHRTLVFSQSTRILDIMERVLEGVKLCRIDGQVRGKERQRVVDAFNDPCSQAEVMLLSTKAGGLGLTLTGADRAIIYDPSWNPAEDSQAVDRCYRIGQNKSVVVYRLIAAGTVEEKRYEKQMYKEGIRRAVMTSMGSATARFFDKQYLRNLFCLAPAGECAVLHKLVPVQHDIRVSRHGGVVGVSSHDAVYNDNNQEEGEDPFVGATPAKNAPQRFDPGTSNRNENNNKSKRKATNKEQASHKNNVPHADSILDTAAEMMAEKELNASLAMLLDLLETNQVKGGNHFMRLHRMIAEMASNLGWIE